MSSIPQPTPVDRNPFPAPSTAQGPVPTDNNTPLSTTGKVAINIYVYGFLAFGICLLLGSSGYAIYYLFWKRKNKRNFPMCADEPDIERPNINRSEAQNCPSTPTSVPNSQRSGLRKPSLSSNPSSRKRVSWASSTSTLDVDGNTSSKPIEGSTSPDTPTRPRRNSNLSDQSYIEDLDYPPPPRRNSRLEDISRFQDPFSPDLSSDSRHNSRLTDLSRIQDPFSPDFTTSPRRNSRVIDLAHIQDPLSPDPRRTSRFADYTRFVDNADFGEHSPLPDHTLSPLPRAVTWTPRSHNFPARSSLGRDNMTPTTLRESEGWANSPNACSCSTDNISPIDVTSPRCDVHRF